MVKRQWIIFNLRQTDQSRMSSIGSPTPLRFFLPGKGSMYATKIVRACRANLAFSPLPPSPILSNTMFDKIDPRGIFSAWTIPRAHGIGNVVAWGPHLRVQLPCQNCEFATPRGEKPPTKHTTINATTIHFRVPQRKTPPP